MGYVNFCLLFCGLLQLVKCIPDQGKWHSHLTEENNVLAISKSLFKDSEVYIRIHCDSLDNVQVKVQWVLTESFCWGDYINLGQSVMRDLQLEYLVKNSENSVKSPEKIYTCNDHIVLDTLPSTPLISSADTHSADQDKLPKLPSKSKSESADSIVVQYKKDQQDAKETGPLGTSRPPVYTVTKDGIYLLTLLVEAVEPATRFKADIVTEMKGTYGYLSAADWPLLPFYGIMCLVYVLFGLAWLLVSFMQWRDLLRIQFWIGAVIFLGMLEKALFYAEYESINITGESSLQDSVLVAEWVSCAKRALARMLVIIVSIGFGIVKPRLGSHLHRIVGVGVAYFAIALWEAYLRVMEPKQSLQLLIASVPLAILDSFICWWIFSSLVQTTRTLRLRRNLVKLTLYNYFTNTLVFAVIASVIFMIYSIKKHRITNCLTDWKYLWIDDAFWHVLFSIVLFVIMILWRPTNNNQRYAFSPLLDAPDDDDDDDEDIDQFVSDTYGVKMRSSSSNRADSPKHKISVNSFDDDLKWVEENIPTTLIDTSMLDSDEEAANTKFEISKMQ